MPTTTSSSTIPELCDHTIDDGRLQFIEKLGEGAYGVVYRAIDLDSTTSSPNPNPVQYAVKVLKKARPRSRSWTYQLREIAAHSRLSAHPNILTLHKVVEEEPYVFLVMEYCPGGDLFRHITEKKTYGGRSGLVKKVFIQILDAVQACHEQGLAHRDIKPDNILCTDESGSKVVLADFGLSTNTEISNTFGCGSLFYQSPETVGMDHGYRPYDPKIADIWSLGVVLVNMVVGRNPWTSPTMNDPCFLRSMTRPGYFRKMLPLSEEVVSILHRIFSYDPRARITIPELRGAILRVQTFFMTPEELAKGHRYAQLAAKGYLDGCRSPTDKECKEVEEPEDGEFDEGENEVKALVMETPTSVFDCVGSSSSMPSMTSCDWDSNAESGGPVTPAHCALASDALSEVPDLKGGEDMCISVEPVGTKTHGRPADSLVQLMGRLIL